MDTKHKLLAAVAFVALVLPGISLAQAQSVATLQQEIASLTAQLQTLEAQLAAAGGSKATWCYTFNSNLSIGMSGSVVTALQTAIQKDGESVTANGTFDDQTAAAVTTFQQKYQSAILAPYGLSNGTGYAGKGTRTELNSLFGCTGSNPVTPPIVVNPIVPTSSPIGIACPMLVPYCPYGGHSVVESNGCTQEVCNQGPTPVTPAQTVSITSVNSKPNGDGYIIAGQSADIVGFGFLATDNVSLSEVSNNSESGSVVTGQLVNGVISFTAPASLPAGQYTIMVSNANGTSNQLTVTVEAASPIATAAPYISQVNPTTAAPGATVTITGQNFDSNSFISLGNVPTGPENMPVAVITETPTSLTFVVPSSLVGAQPLYVAEHNSNLVSNEGTLTISAAPSTIYPIGCTSFSGYSSVNGQSCGCTSSSGYSSANSESCTPATAAPYISQVNPTTAAPGATVTITGQNFDSNSYISIGNVPTGPESEPLAVTSQTATSLTFMIPSNMSPATFPIYVAEHNSGLVSNEGSITILAVSSTIYPAGCTSFSGYSSVNGQSCGSIN
jgi:peptidoglycan hydrolase-like protein with peptidoglycan-binding domain